jgi:hypothetical protein
MPRDSCPVAGSSWAWSIAKHMGSDVANENIPRLSKVLGSSPGSTQSCTQESKTRVAPT